MKKLLPLSAALTMFLGAASAQADKVTYVAPDMTGAKVHPANASTGSADFEITIDTVTMTYCARTTVTPATLVSTGVIISAGDDQVDEGTLFQVISGDESSDVIWNSGDLSAQQITDLGANDYYVQVYSDAFQSGELRDQLSLLDDPGDPGLTCPANDGDAGADAGADAGDAGADAGLDDAGIDAGTTDDAGEDAGTNPDPGAGDGSVDTDGGLEASTGVIPKSDAATSSSSSSGDGTADSTADTSCTTSAPGSDPVGMGFALVGGLGLAAAIRRRRARKL